MIHAKFINLTNEVKCKSLTIKTQKKCTSFENLHSIDVHKTRLSKLLRSLKYYLFQYFSTNS